MPEIRDVVHEGLRAIELRDRGARLIAIHEVGPRIAWFGRTDNFLFWDRTGLRRGDWQLRGGHRLWVTRPGADEAEETYGADNRPCRVRRSPDGVTLIAPPDAAHLEKALIIRARGGRWSLAHRLTNRGDMLWSGGAWALTCTRPDRDTRYRIPLDGGPAAWDVLTMVIPRRWGGDHTSRLDDPQFAMSESAIEIHARGHEAKRMFQTARGALEMRDPARGILRKAAAYQLGATYPRATNVAVYLAPRRFMVELETMSPERTLGPGESLTHVETWSIDAAPRA